jgi:putative copper export protein
LSASRRDEAIGALHYFFGAAFFLTLAFFSLALFRKTDPTKVPTRRKRQRNVVYTVCGYTILACLALIATIALLSDDSPVKGLDPVFWLEAAAVVAFGVSWLTKGEAILADDES